MAMHHDWGHCSQEGGSRKIGSGSLWKLGSEILGTGNRHCGCHEAGTCSANEANKKDESIRPEQMFFKHK